MTEQRLAEIKALRAGITPAPWVADMTSGALWHAASGGDIATINWDHQTGDHQPGGDLEFIADAPLMVDDLLAEVERLRAKQKTLFRRVDLSEPCQYVGCHPVKWGKTDAPTIAFVEVDGDD